MIQSNYQIVRKAREFLALKQTFMKQPVNQRLKMLRRHLELSQKKFAEPLGISEQSYLYIEKGRTKTVGLELLGKVVENYHCDWDWLTKGEGEMMRNLEAENSESMQATPYDDSMPPVPWKDHQELQLKYYRAVAELERALGKSEVSELEKAGLMAFFGKNLTLEGLFGGQVNR